MTPAERAFRSPAVASSSRRADAAAVHPPRELLQPVASSRQEAQAASQQTVPLDVEPEVNRGPRDERTTNQADGSLVRRPRYRPAWAAAAMRGEGARRSQAGGWSDGARLLRHRARETPAEAEYPGTELRRFRRHPGHRGGRLRGHPACAEGSD